MALMWWWTRVSVFRPYPTEQITLGNQLSPKRTRCYAIYKLTRGGSCLKPNRYNRGSGKPKCTVLLVMPEGGNTCLPPYKVPLTELEKALNKFHQIMQ